MTLELRGGVRAAAIPGADPAAREARRALPDARERDADPDHVAGEARSAEEDGLDSALVVQSSSWPDPWGVAAWALARTERLRVVLAHRIGVTAPTAAGRALQTLDRLSTGRAGIHLILGSSDDDVLRDGDGLDKAERYERAAEFLEVFRRTLDGAEPFDFDGRHFRVRDAWSGVRDGARTRPPEVSFAGSSPAGTALAARYADVYGIAVQDPERTRRQIAEVRDAAAAEGRSIRIWANARFVLAEDDERAQARAAATVARAGTLPVDDLDWIRRVRPAGSPRPSPSALRDRARAAVASATVGSPETAARVVADLHRIGVDVVQVTTSVETAEDRHLRRRLVAGARELAAQAAPSPG